MVTTNDKLESQQFITVNNQPISLAQALRYLQSSNKLQSFIEEILRQFFIEQELLSRQDLEIAPVEVEQAIIDFRLQRQLSEEQAFAGWLTSNKINYATFHSSVANSLKFKKLQEQVTAPKLQEYFIERKLFLDRVVISRIIVANQELAEELLSQIDEGTSFEQLAKEYSLSNDRVFNGMMGSMSRGMMTDLLRASVDSSNPGNIIGPLKLEGGWGLFRVEQFIPASLENNQLKQVLQNELFEQWLVENIQKINVQLQVQ